MKKIINLSFSGGRTSAYMCYRMITEMSDQYDFVVTFANTGLEHEKTLEFVNECDIFMGFNTVWLEAEVIHEKQKGTKHKVVNFETASRNGEPFEEVIKKYGFPNLSYLHCTRELKLQPMRSYLKSINMSDIPIAIGIRDDERRRVSGSAEKNNIIYPLVDIWPTDKIEVLEFWKNQSFDLEIEEFEGNCKGCFKKSYKKHFMQIEKDINAYSFWGAMELLYQKERYFFRGNLNLKGLLSLYEETKLLNNDSPLYYENGGCSESCEIFETR